MAEKVAGVIVLGLLGLLAFLLVTLFFLVEKHSSKRARERFEARYPPISDAEFLARCSPGTDPEVALKVRRILADNLGVDYERIDPSMRFDEDLGT